MTGERLGSEIRRRAAWYSGVSTGATVLAVAGAVVALWGRPGSADVEEVDSAIVALGLGVPAAMVCVVFLRLVLRRRPDLAEAVGAPAWILTGAGGIAAFVQVLVFGRHRQLIGVLDVHSSVILATLAAASAVIAAASLGALAAVYVREQDTEDPVADDDRMPTRRTGFVAATATTVIGALIAGVLVVVQQPSLRLQDAEAAALGSPPVPTSMTETAYRIRADDENAYALRAGPGFVVVDGDELTAYEGSRGLRRWTFDAGRIGGLSGSSDTREVVVFGSARDADEETVVVAGGDLSVGLDAVTGRVLWRSAAAAFRVGDGDDRLHRVRFAPRRYEYGKDPTPPTMTLIDPRRGVVLWSREVSCDRSLRAATVDHLVREACGGSGRIEIRALPNPEARQVSPKVPGECGAHPDQGPRGGTVRAGLSSRAQRFPGASVTARTDRRAERRERTRGRPLRRPLRRRSRARRPRRHSRSGDQRGGQAGATRGPRPPEAHVEDDPGR
ncbi:MAG: hypothetical protein QM809_15235 [Gordonia sp. (in: high G+C Gram-positive bacteria)]|uniref:hypothetical protein n=1 Tax=Gordonia sp. (in: high G+C Gram-positive bacteria) TaxID=84139 RepID=UPI0039E2C83C